LPIRLLGNFPMLIDKNLSYNKLWLNILLQLVNLLSISMRKKTWCKVSPVPARYVCSFSVSINLSLKIKMEICRFQSWLILLCAVVAIDFDFCLWSSSFADRLGNNNNFLLKKNCKLANLRQINDAQIIYN